MCLFGNLISKSTVPRSCWHQGPVKSPLLTVELSKWLWEEMSPGQESAESCKGLFNMFSRSWSVCINHIQEQTISRKPSTSICFCKAKCLPWFQDGSGWCLIHACIYEKWSPKIWKKHLGTPRRGWPNGWHKSLLETACSQDFMLCNFQGEGGNDGKKLLSPTQWQWEGRVILPATK
jgi:hypothetical protein